MLALAQAVLTVAYPLLILLALAWFEPRTVALVVVGMLALRLLGLRFAKRGRSGGRWPWPLLVPVGLVGVVAGATAIWNDPIGLLAAPVLVNLALLGSFALSLRGEPIVEQLAHLQVERLSPSEVRYCRQVTRVWCGFFVLNGAIALALALRRDLAVWAFYTGFLAYLAMGTLFAVEYVYRHARFRRYVGAVTDPVLFRIFPPRLAPEVTRIEASGGDQRRRTLLEVPTGLACWPGHFPGEPMLPGVVQVDWALREIERWRGGGARPAAIEGLKFKRPARPGDELVLDLELMAGDAAGAGSGAGVESIEFSFRCGDEAISQGRFRYSACESPLAPAAGGGPGLRPQVALDWPDPGDILVHAAPMIWLRSVEWHDARETGCRVAVADLGAFRDPDGGVGAHVALEWMAQCVAAHAGLERRARGEAPCLGLLLGSKRVRFARAAYTGRESFRVVAVRSWGGDQGAASFDCRVEEIPTGERGRRRPTVLFRARARAWSACGAHDGRPRATRKSRGPGDPPSSGRAGGSCAALAEWRAMKRRVVVTGMAGLSPIGSDWKTVSEALRTGRSGIERLEELGQIDGMATRLGARVNDFEVPDSYPRKRIRSMGRVSLLATRATELALADAGLRRARCSAPVASASATARPRAARPRSPSTPTPSATARPLRGIRATDYVQFMSHTVAANLAQFFEVRGRIVTTCSACTSGSQGIGYGYEAIQRGQAGRDDHRRRRGVPPDRCRGLRRHVRDLDAQRRATDDPAPLRPRPRRAGRRRRARRRSSSRSSSTPAPAARGSTPRSSATAPTATAATSRIPIARAWPR